MKINELKEKEKKAIYFIIDFMFIMFMIMICIAPFKPWVFLSAGIVMFLIIIFSTYVNGLK